MSNVIAKFFFRPTSAPVSAAIAEPTDHARRLQELEKLNPEAFVVRERARQQAIKEDARLTVPSRDEDEANLINSHKSWFQQRQRSMAKKIEDLHAKFEETSARYRVAGWGVGMVRWSSPVTFEKSERSRDFFFFRAKVITPKFFRFKSETLNMPVKRQAVSEMNAGERENTRNNIRKGLTSLHHNAKFASTPPEKKAELSATQKFSIETILHPEDRDYTIILKHGSYIIPSGVNKGDNGYIVDPLNDIHDFIEETKDEKKADDYTRTLALAMVSVSNEIYGKNHDRSEKIAGGTYVLALKYLRNLQMDEALLKPRPVSDEILSMPISNVPAEDLAWRIAYKLSETPMGFEALKTITVPPVESIPTSLSEMQRKSRSIRRDEQLQLFMQGANALLQEDQALPRFSANPSSLIRYCVEKCNSNVKEDNTILIKALPGLQHLMREESGAADLIHHKTAWDNEIEKLENNCPDPIQVDFTEEKLKKSIENIERAREFSTSTWAVNALRNGFYSNAPGSEFDKANQRLEKVTVQVTRGLINNGGAVTPEDAAAVNQVEKNSYLSHLRKIVKLSGKSMFSGSLFFGNATEGPLIQREKMLLALRILEKTLCDNGLHHPNGEKTKIFFNANEGGKFDFERFAGDDDQNMPDEDEETLKNIAQIIMLRSWMNLPISENISGYSVPTARLKKEERHPYLKTLFQGYESETDSNVYQRFEEKIVKQLGRLEKDCLTPELLMGWATNLGLNDTRPTDRLHSRPDVKGLAIPDKGAIKEMGLDESTQHFFDAIEHLQKGQDTRDVLLEENSKAGMARYVAGQIQRMRLGSAVKISDGATVGFGLQGISGLASGIASLLTVSGRANISRGDGRVAQMEVGMNAAGGYARFGVQTEQRNRLGAGASLGLGVGSGASAIKTGVGGAIDVKGIYDTTQFEGVGFRLDRLGEEVTGREGQLHGVLGDAVMSRQLGEIVADVMEGRKAPAKPYADLPAMENYAAPTLLEQLLEKNANLSVTWIGKQDSMAQTIGVTGQAGAIAGAYADGAGAGASAFAGKTQTSRTQYHQERTGALKARVITTGHREANSAQASVAVGVIQGAVAGNDALKKTTFSPGELASGEAEVYRSGISEEIHSIDYLGKLQPRSYKLIIHAKAETFTNKVGTDANLKAWGHTFARIKNNDEYNDGYKNKGLSKEAREEARSVRASVVENQVNVIRDLLAQTESNAHPTVSHIEYLEIDPEIVEQINRYRDLARMSRNTKLPSCEEEADVLDDAAETLLRDENSYRKRFLFSIEKQESDKGNKFNFFANIKTTSEKITTTMTNQGFWG